MFPHPLTLSGQLVSLVPLEKSHVAPLMEIALATPDEWRFTSTPITDEQRDSYFTAAFEERDQGRGYPLVVLSQRDGEILGTTRFADVVWRHKRGEVGFTWFRPSVFGTGINVECKYLMLRFAFEKLDFNRIHLYTDMRNQHSQHAIQALGAKQEGVLRRHMILGDGFIRDTVVFAITDLEWPRSRDLLLTRLAKHGVSKI
jgi:RimJ/RimL family protein N-acetyltransferase